jgi:hypothetical protein
MKTLPMIDTVPAPPSHARRPLDPPARTAAARRRFFRWSSSFEFPLEAVVEQTVETRDLTRRARRLVRVQFGRERGLPSDSLWGSQSHPRGHHENPRGLNTPVFAHL